MKHQNRTSLIAPWLVALVFCAGPGLSAVYADLARQTDITQQRRQQPTTGDQQEKSSPNRPYHTSPGFVAASPLKPGDSGSRAASLHVAIVSLIRPLLDRAPFSLVICSHQFPHQLLHRSCYQAQAPPAHIGK